VVRPVDVVHGGPSDTERIWRYSSDALTSRSSDRPTVVFIDADLPMMPEALQDDDGSSGESSDWARRRAKSIVDPGDDWCDGPEGPTALARRDG
jgi:hypothetical protein